ncbi:MAG: sulfatase-like hydrolase/transferase [Oligoflexia bacterium]|nr:sulfatase-like hydrolase/transferase [Oligoflexia bacterium]MBF0365169.1 sulfatase-like hydrolase/transferase [Oligoflexia bacterium]
MKNYYTPLLKLLAIHILLLFIFRALFALCFFPRGGALTISYADLFYAFYLGSKFDLRFLLLSTLPIFFLGRFARLYLMVIMLPIALLYAADFGYFAYLGSRLSASALELLKPGQLGIAATMLWQSYPLLWIAFGLTLFLFAYHLLLKKLLSPGLKLFPKKIGIALSLILLVALGIYGKLSFYPLRWSEAFFATNNFVSALSLNPILYIVDTWKYKGSDYSKALVEEHYDTVADYLQIPKSEQNRQELSFVRSVRRVPLDFKIENPQKSNVVIIVLESMAAFKSGLFGNPLRATPFMDEFAQNSYFFSSFYVPCQATARSIFSLLTGIPDITSGDTGSRNPMIVEQHSLLNELPEHQKLYFLGGSANWGQIRGLFTYNIRDLTIYEEGSYNFRPTDVWGISDYRLFEEAHHILEQKQQAQKPFVAIIQSAGFHRPYTIPSDVPAFEPYKKVDAKESELLKQYGFNSKEELVSLRFQDFSLQHFFQLAKQSNYYKNTIFFIFGDHGLPVEGAQNVPRGERIHDLENFHVPLLMHAPHLLKSAKKINTLVSEVDILPTVAALLAPPEKALRHRGFGDNIFALVKNPRPVFVYYWYIRPPTYSLWDLQYLLTANVEDRKDLFLLQGSDTPEQSIGDQKPMERKERADLANGLYQSAKYLLYHNRHLK